MLHSGLNGRREVGTSLSFEICELPATGQRAHVDLSQDMQFGSNLRDKDLRFRKYFSNIITHINLYEYKMSRVVSATEQKNSTSPFLLWMS
jgi:hypothetical protein